MAADRADKLILSDIVAPCRIGVTEEERARPQPLRVDVELAIDAKRAAATDQLTDAVDYARLVARIRERLAERPVQLIETAAEAVAELVLWETWSTWVKVRVKKSALQDLGFAAVEIERRR